MLCLHAPAQSCRVGETIDTGDAVGSGSRGVDDRSEVNVEEEQERNCRQSDQRLPFRGRFWVNYRRSRFRRLQGGAPRVPSASGERGEDVI